MKRSLKWFVPVCRKLPRVMPSQTPGYYHANWLMVPRERVGVLRQIAPLFLLARMLPRW